MTEVVEEPGQELELRQQGGVFAVREPAEMIAQAARTADVLKGVVKARGLVSMIGGKEYLTVEAWSTLGVLVGCTARTEWTRPVEGGFEAAVEVVNVNGLVIGRAEACCLRSERNWAKRDDYALRSMAQTRAMGKALRMPLGWIAVLAGYNATPAEEMPQAAAPAVPVVAPEPVSGAAVSHQPETRTDGRKVEQPALTWPEWAARMEAIGVAVPNLWLKEAVKALHGKESLVDLTVAKREQALKQANLVLLALAGRDPSGAEWTLELGPPTDVLARMFSEGFGGVEVQVPVEILIADEVLTGPAE